MEFNCTVEGHIDDWLINARLFYLISVAEITTEAININASHESAQKPASRLSNQSHYQERLKKLNCYMHKSQSFVIVLFSAEQNKLRFWLIGRLR